MTIAYNLCKQYWNWTKSNIVILTVDEGGCLLHQITNSGSTGGLLSTMCDQHTNEVSAEVITETGALH